MATAPSGQTQGPKSVRNVNKEHSDELTPLTRLALWITAKVGTIGFFLVVFVWTAVWLGWNLLAPEGLRFDPGMGFVFWLFISNVLQILLMPLIMVGQNLQGRHAELRADADYEINVNEEQQMMTVLSRLDNQDQMLAAIAKKLDIQPR